MAYKQNYGGQQQGFQQQQYQQQQPQQQQQTQQNFNGSQYGGSQQQMQSFGTPQSFGGQPSFGAQSLGSQQSGFGAPQSFGASQGFGGSQTYGAPQSFGGPQSFSGQQGLGGQQNMGGSSPYASSSGGVTSIFGTAKSPQSAQNQSFANNPYGAMYQKQPQNQNVNFGNTLNQNAMQQQQGNAKSGGVMFGASSQSQSKFWDQSSQNQFTQQMTQQIQQILGYKQFDQNVQQLTNAINQASNQCLKAMKKPNFKYISHTLLVPNGQPYNMGQLLNVQLKTDRCITVRVDNPNITAILEAFCIAH